VQAETEKLRAKPRASKERTIVVFPEPEGAENITTFPEKSVVTEPIPTKYSAIVP
jgi:hypothetical protein